MLLSFFFTSNTGAPHRDTLGRMKPISRSSYNCFFNSCSSFGAIRYGSFDTSAASRIRSMANSTCLSGGIPDRSSGNTSMNSRTIGTSSTCIVSYFPPKMFTKYPWHASFLNIFSACKADTSQIKDFVFIPRNKNGSSPAFWNDTSISLHRMVA